MIKNSTGLILIFYASERALLVIEAGVSDKDAAFLTRRFTLSKGAPINGRK